MKLTPKQKEIWNDAVKATAREMEKWEGLVPDKEDREYLKSQLINRVCYKMPIKSKK